MLTKLLKNYWPVLIIFIAVCAVAITNYKPGTVLSGWDNLHPEFGFGFNIKRSLHAVWQEYQGLGLLGGMGHASDLPRQIFLWIASFIIPPEALRYFFHFLMLATGSLGVYALMHNQVLKNHQSVSASKLTSLSAALFYIFNLATVQMFNVPFEPYSVHFAFLPWLFYVNLAFYKNPNKANFFKLFLVNILAVPQGYIGTFFLVYFIALSLCYTQLLLGQGRMKNIIIAYAVLIIVNAFWLFPNLYFIKSKVNVNVDSKINQMSTEEMFLRNKKYGDFSSVFLFKGFWFDNTEINPKGNIEYQLQDWINHIQVNPINILGYSFVVITLIGITFTLRNSLKNALLFLPVLFFAFTVLANDSYIFNFVAQLFYKIPLFSQVFRFPFTKLSILYTFSFSLFFGLGIYALVSLIKNETNKKIILILFMISPLLYCLPVFSGKLFYYKVRADIPLEYFQLFDYFKKIPPNQRIANFPQYTLWGWTFYRWNYSGSGFIWYGIEQPVLDRAFDVWSKEGENYYHEVSYAIYSGNRRLFEQILSKYQISWILFDGNIISFSNSRELYSDKLETILNSSSLLKKEKQFGKIVLYKVLNKEKENIFFTQNSPIVLPAYQSNHYDNAYVEYGDYISPVVKIEFDRNPASKVAYYPFRSLFTGRSQKDLEFNIEENQNEFIFKTHIPKELIGSTLYLPAFEKEEILELDPFDFTKSVYKYPRVFLDNELIPVNLEGGFNTQINLSYIKNGTLEIRIPKIKGYYSYTNEHSAEFANMAPFACDRTDTKKSTFEEIVYYGKKFIRMESKDGIYCLNIHLDHLSHNFSYIMTVESRNLEGKSLYFSLINNNSYRADLEAYLPESDKNEFNINKSHFIIPRMEQFAQGYLINIKNISIGRSNSINDIGRIEVKPFPFNFLTGIKIADSSENDNNNVSISGYKVNHPNPSYYQIYFDNMVSNSNNPSLMVLSQSYDSGWRAYISDCLNSTFMCRFKNFMAFYFYQEIKDHVIVNNWENGWIINNGQLNRNNSVVIIYKPQYLQYLGFILILIVPLIYLAIPRQVSSSVNNSN